MINWLKKNKKFLSIRAIEQHLEMPNSTLIKAVNGSQKLPKKWENKLNKFIKELVSIPTSE
jgi:fructose-1,6-bisphosphatase